MAIINCIKNNYTNAIISRCFEMGCELKLDGFNEYVILKGEKIRRNMKISDCIIFIKDNFIIAIIELKSRTIHASEIVSKLTNASKIALNILKECKGG